MKGTNPKTPPDLSDLEASISMGPGNGDVLTAGPEIGQNPANHPSGAKTIAHLRVIWENRRFLARVAGVGFVLSAFFALLIPNRFQSVARLMPPDNQSASGLAMAASALTGGAGNLGGIASQLLGMRSNSDLLAGILTSWSAEDDVVRRFDLEKVYKVHRLEDARKTLDKRTDVSIDRKSQIITITVTDNCGLSWRCDSPQRAQAMAQAYIDELNRLVAEVSTSSARRERIFLEGRLHAVSQDLEAAEKEFSLYASKNTTIDIKEQGKAMVDAAATLQGQLIAAQSELEGLRQIYADTNVRVRALQARIGELQDQLRKVGGQDDSTSTGNASPNDSLYPSIRKLPLLGVKYADLYRNSRVEETVFETLTQEYELAKVQEAKEIPTVKVLDPPNLPEKKSYPPRTIITLLGATLAFMCGVAWLFGRIKWEQTDPQDPGKILAQEIYHTIKVAIPWSSRNGFKHDPESRVNSATMSTKGRNSENDN